MRLTYTHTQKKKKIGKNVQDTILGKMFCDLTPKACSINPDKFESIKIKIYYSAYKPK